LVNQKSENNCFDNLDAHFDSKGCPSRGLVPQRIGFPKGCFLRGMVSWRVGFPEVCSLEGFPQRDITSELLPKCLIFYGLFLKGFHYDISSFHNTFIWRNVESNHFNFLFRV